MTNTRAEIGLGLIQSKLPCDPKGMPSAVIDQQFQDR